MSTIRARLLNTRERLWVRKTQGKHCAGYRCDRYLKRSEFHVDHIIPRSQGGTNDPKNLQALCITCHGKKTALETKIRMTGSIRTTKAEQEMGLPKWIPG
jgi:5-methylcytosine-specific restriction endonuclease McrA